MGHRHRSGHRYGSGHRFRRGHRYTSGTDPGPATSIGAVTGTSTGSVGTQVQIQAQVQEGAQVWIQPQVRAEERCQLLLISPFPCPSRREGPAAPAAAPGQRLRRERLRGAAPPFELKPPSPLPIGCAARRAPPPQPIRVHRAPFRMFNGPRGAFVSASAVPVRSKAKRVPLPGAACCGRAGSVLFRRHGCCRQARAVAAASDPSVCAVVGGSVLVPGGGI